ncbi:ARM repeat superfamily protein [Striga hermonthica]|uniref:ARM repeat superfamily protein n=1 Tax=Striga hermonthica TaxID=68872 RepID=A0A9N7R0L5_STRHE|nr:ARM repeat superfamily protein [Striga hermonthica]
MGADPFCVRSSRSTAGSLCGRRSASGGGLCCIGRFRGAWRLPWDFGVRLIWLFGSIAVVSPGLLHRRFGVLGRMDLRCHLGVSWRSSSWSPSVSVSFGGFRRESGPASWCRFFGFRGECEAEAEAKSLHRQKQSHLDQHQNDPASSSLNPSSEPKIPKSKPEPSSKSLAEEHKGAMDYLSVGMDQDQDQDQQGMISCLNVSLDPSKPGYGVALARFAAQQESVFEFRHISLMILEHWNEDEEGFEHPVVESNEKAAVKGLLLALLDDPRKEIRIAVSAAVSAIALYDWPEDWPELVPSLITLILRESNLNGVHGALLCLSPLSSDMDDKTVPQLVPHLFPCLHWMISNPQIYHTSLRSKALSLIYNCNSMSWSMSGVYEEMETTTDMLESWMDTFSSILLKQVPSEDPDDWSIRKEVIKCLNQFIQNFSTFTKTYCSFAHPYVLILIISYSGDISVIEWPFWETFGSTLEVYERSAIEGNENSYDEGYDSDGAEQSLESFVIELFKFLLTATGSPRSVKVVMDNVFELVYYTIGFLQMTERQVQSWSNDANKYVADEDNSSYCRVHGK